MKLVFGDAIDERLRLEVVDAPTVLRGEGAAYVLEGSIVVDGIEVPTGGAAVLHGGAEVEVTGDARLACFGGGPTEGDGDHHLLGPGGRSRTVAPSGSRATWFADSTCPGCDVALFWVERRTPGERGRSHSHTADEILLVLDGSIRLGAHEVPAGQAVFVPADVRYAVTSGPEGHRFLNYRASASLQHYEGDAEALPENASGRDGEDVGDVLR